MSKSPNIEHITEPEIMTRYLSRLQRGHMLLTARIAELSNSYNTIIIDVDDSKQQLLFDVLHPESGHKEVMKRKEFSVAANYEGIKISFKVSIKKLINDDGKPAYLVGYPASLTYHQQRASYRAPIGSGEQVGIKVTSEKEQQAEGRIIDISLGGLGLRFDAKKALPFKIGMLLPACQFDTPDKADFECALEVRNIRLDPNKRFAHIGVRFMQLDKQKERQIQRFVVQLERDMIKRKQV